jgi:mannose-6-phosphate isomerase-like protein (cupin superfamily)|tara:strand:+ start:11327 stop:11716 length:390 start_codon:yes stop_codon:yes gene_type:complete
MLNTDEDIPYIDKPWGYERIWAQTDKYVAKYIYIKAGHRMSRQYHEKKDETVYVLSGPLILELGPDHEDDEIVSLGLMEGESYHVTPEAVHRFCASEEYNVELIEVSTPELADVIRLEDDYDRTPNISA